MNAKNRTIDRSQKDYDASDVQHLLRVRQWRSYDEMIKWLQREGDNDNELTQGEVRHLIDDLSRIRQRGAEMISEPNQLYKELKR
jgi:RNA polymerase-interacting CarD/CdnL/TRCF family regulator